MNHTIPAPADALTRRGFLSSSTKIAGGAALLSSLPVERFAHAASPGETLKIALVGSGGRGSGAASQALSTGENVQLVAVADVHPDNMKRSLKNLSEKHKDKVKVTEEKMFTGFDAYKKAIALADVVILATPPGFRPMQFEEAVKQGKHVFMEKPVCVDGPGFRKVMAAAEEAKRKNLKVGVGLQRHHQKSYLETLKRIQDGAIGDIAAMRCYWNGSRPWCKKRADLEKQYGRKLTEMEYQMRNWYYFTWICGDHICEQHIHNLDVCNWFKGGHPVRANGMGGCELRLNGPDEGEIFDHHAVEFEYADGTRMFSQCRHMPGTASNVSESLIGTKGTADCGGSIKVGGETVWRYKSEGAKDAYQQEHDDLFSAIRDDKPFNEAFYGAESSMTSVMGRMATYSGQIVTWEKAIASEINLMPDNLAWDAPTKVNPGPDGLYPKAIPGKTKVI